MYHLIYFHRLFKVFIILSRNLIIRGHSFLNQILSIKKRYIYQKGQQKIEMEYIALQSETH